MESNRVIASIIVLMVISGVVIGAGVIYWSNSTKGGTVPPASTRVYIANFAFHPQNVTVSPGTTVVWTNNDTMDHTVTSLAGAPVAFESGTISQGKSFSYTFTKSGTYPYKCSIHPFMRGNVTVGGGSNSITIYLQAKNIAFNLTTITVPAGANVTIIFNNQDSGTPHNFAVYTNSSASTAIFQGSRITGVSSTIYNFVAPTVPGNYFFRCDVHPTLMTGTFVVTASGPPAPGNKVIIMDYSYAPANLTVPRNTTVTWVNDGTVSHSVVSLPGAAANFSSGVISPGAVYSYNFTMAGYYPYYDTYHPIMKGNITVT